jgi:hypothetical protein
MNSRGLEDRTGGTYYMLFGDSRRVCFRETQALPHMTQSTINPATPSSKTLSCSFFLSHKQVNGISSLVLPYFSLRACHSSPSPDIFLKVACEPKASGLY